MSAKIIELADRRFLPRPTIEVIRFRIEKNGDLTVRPVRSDGVALEALTVDQSHVERLLTGLLRKARAQRLPPGEVPVAPRAPRKRIHKCHRDRDGSNPPVGGCRRHAGHAGRCKDARGSYEPAICSHIGFPRTRIVSAEGTVYKCFHCGSVVP